MAETLDLLMFGTVVVLLMAGFPVAFTLGGVALAFALLGDQLGVFNLGQLSFLPQRMFGIMSNEVVIAVPLFVLMGLMLERSKVAEDLLTSMASLFRGTPGGLAMSVMVVGALLAASTGIVGATVVTMGLISLPVMLKYGYDQRLATGTICAAGTLGQIIPPSIVLVFLGDFLTYANQQANMQSGNLTGRSVSVGDLFAGSLLPGLMLVGLYLVYQFLLGRWRPERCPPIPPEALAASADGRSRGAVLRDALIAPAGLIVAVLGSILGGIATPTEAAGLGAVGATFLAAQRLDPRARRWVRLGVLAGALLVVLNVAFDLRLARQEMPLADRIAIYVAMAAAALLGLAIVACLRHTLRGGTLVPVVYQTARITAMAFTILIGASLFSLTFRGFGGEETVRAFLEELPGGLLGALLVVMLIMFVMGFFLDFLEIIFIVVPIVAPILIVMGADPVWLGVMIAMNLQTSFLTPPFGFALFYLRGVAPPTVSTGAIYRGIIPFVLIQLLALALLWIFPGIATWLPAQLFGS